MKSIVGFAPSGGRLLPGAGRDTAAGSPLNDSRTWPLLSLVAAGLAFAGSAVALSVDSIYADLTPAFLDQALAQDVANLVVIAPAMAASAVLARRASLRARMIWLGTAAFTVYNYLIYTLAVPFGPLFPLWIAVLGLSLFALIGGLTSLDVAAAAARFTSRSAVVASAWSLMVVAGLFGLLWLSEDVPALINGTMPQSALDLALPTQPVHVLDYAFFLPAAITSGVMLLRRRAFAFPVTVSFLVFLLLTCLPILLTPVVQAARDQHAVWDITVPVGPLALGLLALLLWLLRTVRAAGPEPPTRSSRSTFPVPLPDGVRPWS